MYIFFMSLGCDKNLVDSEEMLGALVSHGFEVTDDESQADVIVVNTCCFIHDAKEESIQAILEMADYKTKGNLKALIVTGCLAQRYKEEITKEIPEVDAVLGTNSQAALLDAVDEALKGKVSHVFTPLEGIPQMPGKRMITTGGFYEYLKIAEGCNKHCTYCIIPYARGRVRSRKIAHVMDEVHALAAKGYKEVVLTGIHLSSYGVDFPAEEKETLLSLIRAVHEVEGIERIRLGSLEPGIITEEFVQSIAALPKMCPHFHLSLQSGCDTTLERMNRRYRSAEYAEKCGLLRKYLGNPALTTDVIVGFPMETEEDFQDSYDFVESIHFYETHIFKYSRRHGTKAAAMSGQLTEAQKAVRSDKMLALNEQHAKEYEKSMLGGELKVLLEEEVEINGEQWYIGHSMEYIKTAVKKQDNYSVNDIITVKAEEFLEEHTLTGEVLGAE